MNDEYNVLVGKIKKAYLNAQTDSTKAVLEDILPELRESEDERIRKEIISALKYANHKDVYDKHLAWLEKQGEQKPIINVPSREVILAIWDLGNEWKELTNGSISTEYGTQLYYIQKHWHESEYYLQKKQGEQKSTEWHKGDEQNLNACLGYIPDEYLRRWLMDVIHVKYDKPTDKVEPKFHKGQWIAWQDKCYKVNYNGCGYELFDQNGLSTSWGYKAVEDNAHLWDVTKDAKPGDVLYSQKHNLIWVYKDNKHYYASINLNYADGISFDGDIVIPSDVCPATKEQRDLLFQMIEETGYEWSDKDRKLINKKELKKIEQKPADNEMIEILRTEYEKGRADAIAEMQNTAWSEEDELHIRELENLVKQVWATAERENDKDKIHKMSNLSFFLKTLKPQLKQEWSKDDEAIWTEISDLLWEGYKQSSSKFSWDDIRNWVKLKFLKHQYTWKPSEEQLDALQYVYRNSNPLPSDKLGWNSLKTLELMYHDLKKLREE